MTTLEKRVSRVTRTELGGQYGPDRGRRLVVSIVPNPHGDMIEIRPLGTRRSEQLLLEDVYRWAIAARVRREQLERARARKERKAAARAARREAYQRAQWRAE